MMGTKFIAAVVLACALAMSAAAQDARKALSKPAPRYPDIARRMNLAGSVKIEIVIGPDGKIKETNVVGGHPILVDSVLVTLKEWRYEPSKGETTLSLTFDFRP